MTQRVIDLSFADNVELIRSFIEEEAGDAAAEANLASARDVLEFLPGPTGHADARGLILGRIQAGKTMAILATIALAADNGYRIFVVLTSDNTWLYSQTHERLSKALPSLYFPDEDTLDTLPVEDIRERGAVFVCTKNAVRLTRLIEQLTSADLNLPALIIDDEADQASLDTNARNPGTDASRINARITDLRGLFANRAFLQVTATSSALFLQPDGHDYRPEFVVVLEPGPAYVGGSILFAEDSPHIRGVDLQELLDFLGGRTGLPRGLKQAVLSFLTAAAIRRMFNPRHRSYYFLCHVSHLRDRHDQVRAAIEAYLNEIAASLGTPSSPVVLGLKEAYDNLSATVQAPPDFEKVIELLQRFIPSNDVQVLNADSELAEPRSNRIFNFLIGGNRLGRGVTIKRLLTTYYARAVRRPQMDTMQQHARMYGYRRDELDVIRIFTPRDMAEQFRFLNESDTALRELIRTGRYEGIENIVANLGMNATRGNVLAGTVVGYVAGRFYSPQFPKYLREDVEEPTRILDAFLADRNPTDDINAPAEMVSIDMILQILEHCGSYGGGGLWEDDRIRSALQALKGYRFQEGYLAVRRGRDLNRPEGRLRDPASHQDRAVRRADGPTLWMFRQNGDGWDGVPFWIPRLQLPDGNFAISFNADGTN